MAHIYQNVPPSELTAIARYILTTEELEEQADARDNQRIRSFAPWFEMVFEDTIEVTWDEGIDTPYTDTAPMRDFDTPVPEGSLPGTLSRRAGMIPTGLGYTMTELDILLQRIAGGGSESDIMLAAADERIRRGVIGARNRMLQAQADLIVNSTMTADEYGIKETVTVTRDPLNEPTAGDDWVNTGTADPHDDELAAMERLENVYSLTWEDLVVVCTRPAVNQYRTIDNVASELNTNRVLSGRPSRAEINDLRAGRDLPPVLLLNRSLKNTQGVVTKLLPDNFWMIMPRPGITVGKQVWGSPASLEGNDVDIALDDRPGPVVVIEESGPVPLRRRVITDALGMPYSQAPNWVMRIETNNGL